MTACVRGDVVLVSFIFTDEAGAKLRPAVVLSSNAYNQTRHEVIVSAVTSNVRRRLAGDCLLRDWKSAGLLFPSVATGIIRTVKAETVTRRLGAVTAADLSACERALRKALGL